jgi:hypothetical protein
MNQWNQIYELCMDSEKFCTHHLVHVNNYEHGECTKLWSYISHKSNIMGLCTSGSYNTNYDDHVDGVRLCLWTVAINRPIGNLPGNICAWRATVKLYQQGKTLDSSIRVLWQSYPQSHFDAKQEELAKEIINLTLWSIFVHTFKGF